ncbi:hypothetical protein E2C01_099848 [Portunus trituberculatus]|uniref:Uncharacterized protein n=1 Tax=Portunus trituberculatus TaxID=210409 RepID=A0A5B7KBS7_PORTR|nr:hypothetical protein [Portunus trituberculatus]
MSSEEYSKEAYGGSINQPLPRSFPIPIPIPGIGVVENNTAPFPEPETRTGSKNAVGSPFNPIAMENKAINAFLSYSLVGIYCVM